ncbi:NADH flavin oxidoreductase 1 [Gloeophyllum trabeum ATCC 11539]|uniref:NADH flavin oxidoreductase 1 n=1 Tax=Gloeophyllum trabeum (strain ATCC 11539 / FP-39264 / Madison 617) TaxID=670483 RepID=S7QLT8_GLOTA|nr:NADH flavin oxidoreductase 1 [Gloeophyllum trabeum ATCC 11539]EPQ60402.1 NADH flavin oxidoreductase 1 [Gloeophyllum trabeum ATCC 11539]
MAHLNKPVPGADQYYPLNEPGVGIPYPQQVYAPNAALPKLFQPLTLRGVTFHNRIFVSPMCQYSSDTGHATDWHLVHIGTFASRGLGAIVLEATSIVPEGRISPEDAGLWTDTQIPPLQRIVNFARSQQGPKIGIQLSHAGRKASTLAPWVRGDIAQIRVADRNVALKDEKGWPDEVYGPSTAPFAKDFPQPKEMSEEHLQYVEDEWLKAVERCKQIGFDFIEIHAAHGYLLHSWLSPLSNVRTDQHGGPSLENRMRFPLRLIARVRAAWAKPLFVRLSASDWADGPEQRADGSWAQWGIEQSKTFVARLREIGIDLVDVSSGGNHAAQRIPLGEGYQVPFAQAIKAAVPGALVGAVGMITDPKAANGYLEEGKADVVFLARELIRNPSWVMRAALEMGVAVKPANQYERGWTEVLSKK